MALLSIALFAAACSSAPPRSDVATTSGPAPRTGRAIEVHYRAYASAMELGLVNESHTERAELYSQTRPLAAASVKVATDEILEEVVRYFREQGFFELARSGAAPASAPQGGKQALEVATPEGRVHVVLREGFPQADTRRFLTCVKAFLDVYNATVQLQSVDRPPDWDDKRPVPPRKRGS